MSTSSFNQINVLRKHLETLRRDAQSSNPDNPFVQGYLCALKGAIDLCEIQQLNWRCEQIAAGDRSQPVLALD